MVFVQGEAKSLTDFAQGLAETLNAHAELLGDFGVTRSMGAVDEPEDLPRPRAAFGERALGPSQVAPAGDGLLDALRAIGELRYVIHGGVASSPAMRLQREEAGLLDGETGEFHGVELTAALLLDELQPGLLGDVLGLVEP